MSHGIGYVPSFLDAPVLNCLRVLIGLKADATLCFSKILLTHSDTPCTYGNSWLISHYLTHNVRTGDSAMHRDKEMWKINKCSQSVRWTVCNHFPDIQTIRHHHFSWLAYGQRTRFFFNFQIFLTLADILSWGDQGGSLPKVETCKSDPFMLP